MAFGASGETQATRFAGQKGSPKPQPVRPPQLGGSPLSFSGWIAGTHASTRSLLPDHSFQCSTATGPHSIRADEPRKGRWRPRPSWLSAPLRSAMTVNRQQAARAPTPSTRSSPSRAEARRFLSSRPGACLTRDDQPLLRAFAGADPGLRWDRLSQAVPMRSSRIIDHATALLLAGGLCYGQVREAAQEELPERLRDARWLAGIKNVTAQRVRDGEWDHVVFYALQSRRFTELPPVEPGVSARQWKRQRRIPDDAAARLRAFVASRATGVRHTAMRAMVQDEEQLNLEYARAMRFLYEKEWTSREHEGAARREYVAGLYQRRGHSTDTDNCGGQIRRGCRGGHWYRS